MSPVSYASKDFYKSYIDYVKDNPVYKVTYKVFKGIINDYFKYLRDEVIENGKEVKLPCRMGTLSVVKRQQKRYKSIRKSLTVDFGETKKQGKCIYNLNDHTGGFSYRFHWSKLTMLTSNKSKYKLIMTRANKRHLAQILKQGLRDYREY